MKMNWKKQTIVITGAYGGLGKALAQTFYELGADLILIGRDKNKLQTMQESFSNDVEIFVGDVTASESVEKLSALLKNKQNQNHMLINNAAVNHTAFLSDSTTGDIEETLQVNLLAPILLTQKLLPWLKAADKAQIINIGSSFGAIGYPGFSVYSASKFGLRGFTQALSRELSDTQISVSYLAPRAMSTEINSTAVNQMNSELGNAVDDPVDIALMVVQSIEKNHTEKFYGWPEKLFVKINALLPSMVSKAIKKDHSTIEKFLKNEVKS